MCLLKRYRRWRKRRHDRIYEGPSDDIDGGTRISFNEDAPKEIQSRELVSFSCRFSAVSLDENETKLIRGVYNFGASKGADGVSTTVGCNNPRVVPEGERKAIHSEKFLQTIDALLRKYNVAKHNGYYYKVSGLPDFYGAKVDCEYASGETLYCYNNQDPFLPIEFVHELCRLFGVKQENKDV